MDEKESYSFVNEPIPLPKVLGGDPCRPVYGGEGLVPDSGERADAGSVLDGKGPEKAGRMACPWEGAVEV